MDDTRDPSNDGKDNVDEQINTASSLNGSNKRWEKNGKDAQADNATCAL